MRQLLRESVALLVRLTCLPWLIRRFVARRAVTIVLYHDPGPGVLRRHLEYYRTKYRMIPLRELVTALVTGDWSRIPPHALVVTLDDGHKGNYHLLPLFREFGVVPTIYLCSQVVGTGRRYWFKVPPKAASMAMKLLPAEDRSTLLRERHGQ